MAEPSIVDLLLAAQRAVRGGANRAADFIRGSDYDVLAGVGAMIWSRIAQRDTDLFKATRFGSAEGKDLERLMFKRYAVERIKDTSGTGFAEIERPATGPIGTVWAGTRIRLTNAATGLPKLYVVTVDTPVTTDRIKLPIRADGTGAGWKVNTRSNLTFVDAIWDPTFTVRSLECSDGQVFETAAQFRARIRAQQFEARVGHEAAIVDACKAAGADRVVLFSSDYGGEAFDHGLNVCYVGGLGYTSTPSLVRDCTLAVRAARVAGDHLQVLPMSRTDLDVTATVYLQDSPASYDTQALYRAIRAAIYRHIGSSNGDFTYTIAGMTGAIAAASDAVQDVVITSPSADAAIIVNGNFPASLVRYMVRNVTLSFQPPR